MIFLVIIFLLVTKFFNVQAQLSTFPIISNILTRPFHSNAEKNQMQANSQRENCSNIIEIEFEDAFSSIKDLTIKYGYVFEEHEVKTEDGFILKIHRVNKKHGLNENVVFLMHGILDSSDSWIIQGPNKALAYILADKQYDVWLGNARGNKYGLQHEHLDPRQSEFWQFSWEEIGIFDLSASFDYILNVTRKQKLIYVGHSQGTTAFYALNSLRPVYNGKVKLMVSLAPVAWMGHTRSPLARFFSPANKLLGYLLSTVNVLSPTTDLFNKLITNLCSWLSYNCKNSIFTIVGESELIDSDMLPIVLGHMPSGSSVYQFVHYGQLVESGRFCRYDFDEELNLQYYGQSTPPDYNLSEVTVPIYLFYSDNDLLSDEKDVKILQNNLKSVIDAYKIDNFSNLDYMYAPAAKDLVYLKVLNLINNFNYTDQF